MEPGFDRPVDDDVQGWRLGATETHVTDRTLVSSLAGGGDLSAGSCSFELGLLRSPGDTCNDIGHGSATIGTEDLDGDEVCLLGDTILARSYSTGAVRTMTVSILIYIVDWDSFPPGCATLELLVVNVDTGINDVYVNTLATVRIIYVLGESAKGEFIPMADTGKTLWRLIRVGMSGRKREIPRVHSSGYRLGCR